MSLDEQALHAVINVDASHAKEIQQKINDIRKRFEILFEHKYQTLSRFQVDNFVADVDTLVGSIDSFIEETETQANRPLRDIAEVVRLAEQQDFQKAGNPYYESTVAASDVIQRLYIAIEWRALIVETFIRSNLKLHELLRTVRDIEFEAQKLDAEKALSESVIDDYKAAMQAEREHSNALQGQIIRLTTTLNQFAATLGREPIRDDQPNAPVPVQAVPEPENSARPLVKPKAAKPPQLL